MVAIEHSVAGPLASRILRELGAEVIKIERPDGGDFSRHWDSYVHGEGAQLWWLNRAKRSLALDLKSSRGQTVLAALLENADVLVQNLAPSSAQRLGLDGPALSGRFPRLINCQISGYGAAGPAADRKAYDMLIQAEAGVMSLTGLPERPMRVGVSISDVTTGIYAALLILAALHERNQTGIGRFLDVAMMDVTLEFLGPMLMSYLNSGVKYPRVPDHHHAIAPYGIMTCGDGEQLLIAIEQDSEWQRFCRDVLLDDELGSDERFTTNVKRVTHREHLHGLVSSRLAIRPSIEVIDALKKAGLAYGRLNDVVDIADHDVVVQRGLIREALSSSGESVVRLPGIAERLFETTAERDRPPTLGEDSAELLAEYGVPTTVDGIDNVVSI